MTSGVPSPSVAQVRWVRSASGSASTCRVTVTSFGTGIPENGLSRENAARFCGLSQLSAPPSVRPPRRSRTGTRSSLFAGEMRAGKAHQDAAILDPFVEPLARRADIADVGEEQHRQLLVEEASDGFSRRNAFGEPHIGERIERALQVIARADQRLRAVGGRARNDADGAAAPALVEQLHGAGRAFAGDLEPRHVVADLDRQVDHRLGLALGAAESKARLAERQSFEVDGVNRAALRPAASGRAAL